MSVVQNGTVLGEGWLWLRHGTETQEFSIQRVTLVLEKMKIHSPIVKVGRKDKKILCEGEVPRHHLDENCRKKLNYS